MRWGKRDGTGCYTVAYGNGWRQSGTVAVSQNGAGFMESRLIRLTVSQHHLTDVFTTLVVRRRRYGFIWVGISRLFINLYSGHQAPLRTPQPGFRNRMQFDIRVHPSWDTCKKSHETTFFSLRLFISLSYFTSYSFFSSLFLKKKFTPVYNEVYHHLSRLPPQLKSQQ